jgi:hypothetical protein
VARSEWSATLDSSVLVASGGLELLAAGAGACSCVAARVAARIARSTKPLHKDNPQQTAWTEVFDYQAVLCCTPTPTGMPASMGQQALPTIEQHCLT